MDPEEERNQQDHSQQRRHRRERFGVAFRDPFDEADLVEARRQRQQRGKIEEDFPGAFFGDDVLEFDHAGDQHQRDHHENHHGRVDEVGAQQRQADGGVGAGDPEEHRQQHQCRHDPFVARRLSHRGEFGRTPGDDFRALLHFRTADQITQQRHQQQQGNPERRKSEEPLRPADIDIDDLPRDAERRGIGRQRGQEHRRGNGGGRERGPHHIGANLARGGTGFGAVDPGNVADDRIDGAAGARGVGRRRRRQHQIRKRNGITESDGMAAEAAHQHQGQPPPETALAVSDREHEGADDQPHRAFGKTSEHPAQRLVGIGLDIAHHAGNGETDQADRADRHRFKDQARDDGREQREIVPLAGIKT